MGWLATGGGWRVRHTVVPPFGLPCSPSFSLGSYLALLCASPSLPDSLDFHLFIPLLTSNIPILLLLLHLPCALQGTCMSTTEESEVVDLSLEFSGLSISVRGSPRSATRFVQGLASSSAHHSAASSSGPEPSTIQPAEASFESAVPAGAVRPSSSTTSETRSSILASFPFLPAIWRVEAETQLTSSKYTGEYRASRAWTAGHWARATDRGRVSSPNRSETISLDSGVWSGATIATSLVASPHRSGSIKQLDGLRGRTPFVTHSHLCLRRGSTWRLLGVNSLPLSRSNGGWNFQPTTGLQAMCPGDGSRRCPRRWRGFILGPHRASQTVWTFAMRSQRLLLRRGLSKWTGGVCRGSDWPIGGGDSACRPHGEHGRCRTTSTGGWRRASGHFGRCFNRLGGATSPIQYGGSSLGVGSHLPPRRAYLGSHDRRIGASCMELGPRSRVWRTSCLLLSSRRGGSSGDSKICKSSSSSKSRFWYSRRKGAAKERSDSETKGHCCHSGSLLGTNVSHVASPGPRSQGTIPENREDGTSTGQRGRQVISIAPATWRITYEWITFCTGDSSGSSERDAAPEKYHTEDSRERCGHFVLPAESGGGTGGRTGAFGRQRGPDKSRADAEPSTFIPGVSTCFRGQHGGSRSSFTGALQQGSTREDEATTRTSSSQRHLFQCSLLLHGQADAACETSQLSSSGAGPQRCDSNPIHREVWGIRPLPRHRQHHVAGGADHGLPSGRQRPSRKRCSLPLGSVPGTNRDRWWKDGGGSASCTDRGAPSWCLQHAKPSEQFQEPGLCTNVRPKVDHQCSLLHEGTRCNHHQAGRVHRRQEGAGRQATAAKSQESTKEAKSRVEKASGGRRGTRMSSHLHAPELSFKKPAKDLFSATTTVPKILAAFPRWILSSRTAFGALLAKTFHIQRSEAKTPASVAFPLPLADFNLFKRSGPKLSKRQWTCLLRKRMRHIVIVALNYLHGFSSQEQLPLLGRRPNSSQRLAHERLWSLIATCETPGTDSIPLVPGRSGTEFIARLSELESFASSSPLLAEEFYGGGPKDLAPTKLGTVAKTADSMPFEPYSNLNSERIKLVGAGSWPLADFLQDELWLPYVEPKILNHDLDLRAAIGPNLNLEDRDENLKLALLWDSKGLLSLSRSPPHKGAFTRVFNARKDKLVDRQIGDRRYQNFCERSIRGPSKHLPGGYLLTGLIVPQGCIIRGSITDRKDFYHQASATYERAQTNCLPFNYSHEELKDTNALKDLLELEKSAPRGRENVGDKLGFKPKSILGSEVNEFYPNFRSLLQGDHLGVEFALSAHDSLLTDAGLLNYDQKIQGGVGFPSGPIYQGLCIDDFFILAVEPGGCKEEESEATKILEVATKEYKQHGVLGSIEKDVKASRHFKVIGAEINASETAVSELS